MDKCVHCGFCLASCPSYLLLGREMASPRGRIYLMRAGVENRVAITSGLVEHFDTCLGCMACETACPSGVRYAPLIEETRAVIEHHHQRALSDRLFRRLLFLVLPYPRRLRALAAPLFAVNALRRWPRLMAVLPTRLRNLIVLAPDAPGRITVAVPALTRAAGEPRRRVGLVTGCVQRVFFGKVNEATARILSAEGCDVLAPADQGCCGALALHAGRDEEAREFARQLIQVFDSAAIDTIVVNAAGCGSAMKGYGELLADDPVWADRAGRFAAKVRDVTEAIVGLGTPRAARRPLHLRVAYHDACHLAHAQGVRREPRQLLESIPGVTVVPIAESEICCGSAGLFNLVQPELASALGSRKADRIAESSPDVVVTSNPGCILQIRAAARSKGHSYRVRHIVELLDAAISGDAGPHVPDADSKESSARAVGPP